MVSQDTECSIFPASGHISGYRIILWRTACTTQIPRTGPGRGCGVQGHAFVVASHCFYDLNHSNLRPLKKNAHGDP